MVLYTRIVRQYLLLPRSCLEFASSFVTTNHADLKLFCQILLMLSDSEIVLPNSD